MKFVVLTLVTLAGISNIANAGNCTPAKQNWNQGNSMTCPFDRDSRVTVQPMEETPAPQVEAPAPEPEPQTTTTTNA